jgi:hypothetical protein
MGKIRNWSRDKEEEYEHKNCLQWSNDITGEEVYVFKHHEGQYSISIDKKRSFDTKNDARKRLTKYMRKHPFSGNVKNAGDLDEMADTNISGWDYEGVQGMGEYLFFTRVFHFKGGKYVCDADIGDDYWDIRIEEIRTDRDGNEHYKPVAEGVKGGRTSSIGQSWVEATKWMRKVTDEDLGEIVWEEDGFKPEDMRQIKKDVREGAMDNLEKFQDRHADWHDEAWNVVQQVLREHNIDKDRLPERVIDDLIDEALDEVEA